MVGLIAQPAHALTPEPGEDQPAFAVRFHAVMRRRMPDTDGRNAAMLRAWSAHDELATRSRQRWPRQKYQRVDGVPVFDEHATTDGDGTPVSYTRDDLAQIVRNMNAAISDTGNYPALTDGHTPDDENGVQPEVLGYSGPFYLGQVGQDSPRFAIFATEWHRRDKAPVLATHLCRSPEVWRTPRPQDRIMGPIAALGAEVPRRFNGMAKYARLEDGTTVERYAGRQAVLRYAPAVTPAGTVIHRYAAAFASPATVALPPDRYSKDNAPMPDSESKDNTDAAAATPMPALSDPDVARIVKGTLDALAADPRMQFIETLMSRGTEADDLDDDDPEAGSGSPADASETEPGSDSAGQPPTDDSAAAAAPATDPDQAAATPTDDSGAEPAGDDPLLARIASLQAENAALKKQLAAAGGAQTEHYRRGRIAGMRAKGYQVDVDDCLTIASDFTDEQFEKYARSLERTAVRVPLAGTVDVPKAAEPARTGEPTEAAGDPRMEKYARQAREIHRANVAAGRPSTYETVLREVLTTK